MGRFQCILNELKCGWADLHLVIDDQRIECYFENVPNDPLYLLLESAMKEMGRIDAKIIFHDGSHTEYLSVMEKDNSLCCINTEHARVDLPVAQYRKAVLRMFDAYVFAFSQAEYSANWSVYPAKEVEKLRALYHL